MFRGSTSGGSTAVLTESSQGDGLPIPLNTVTHGIILVQGIAENGSVSRFARQVCVKNVNGTSSLVSTNITIGADDSGTTALAITVNDSAGTDTLQIAVTGTSGTNYRWSAVLYGAQQVGNVTPS